jgi:hypothetical protein
MRGLGIVAVVAACAHNVPQDDHTGEDGHFKGAREIKLENGEGKVKGVVTYPGGDRVDWKFVELDKDKRGQLEVDLKWTPPRAGLRLNFDVFDQWNVELATGKAAGKRSRFATIPDAKGKYFIRVYAVGRGDAGAYKLAVDFKEHAQDVGPDVLGLPIPDPPRLAAVPPPEVGCNESVGDVFDPKNPKCFDICPTVATPPPGWRACVGQCVGTPDPNNSACWDKVCPNPPTIDSKKCMQNTSVFPPCNAAAPDPKNWNCVKPKNPVTGRAINVQVSGSDTIVTIDVGSDNGVERSWKGQVLRGESTEPLIGGQVTITNVSKRKTVAKVHLTVDVVQQNPQIKLVP